MKNGSATENFMIVIGFAEAFVMIGSMILELSSKPDMGQCVIIESDYAGEIVLDRETNTRYLRTDEGCARWSEEVES